jgi:hypothetical protein
MRAESFAGQLVAPGWRRRTVRGVPLWRVVNTLRGRAYGSAASFG